MQLCSVEYNGKHEPNLTRNEGHEDLQTILTDE